MPPGVTTVTSTVAGVSDGAVTTIWVAELLTIVAATLPKFTAVAVDKSVPVMVTVVPPVVGPDDGLIPLTTGMARANSVTNASASPPSLA